MPRIEFLNYTGMTGSTRPKETYFYYSEEPFDKNSLPETYRKLENAVSAFWLDFPKPMTPYYCMMVSVSLVDEYQYWPLFTLVTLSDRTTAIFPKPAIVSGDWKSGRLSNSPLSTYTVTHGSWNEIFGETVTDFYAGISIWLAIDGNIVQAQNAPFGKSTIRKLYMKGALALSGDLTDILPPEIITELGGPVTQGLEQLQSGYSWKFIIPSVEQFKKHIGPMFNYYVNSDNETRLYTSVFANPTPALTSSFIDGSFVSIDMNGDITTIGLDDELSFYGLIVPDLTDPIEE